MKVWAAARWRVMGTQQVAITASSEVVWGIKKLNLALALDNTGSMASSGKIVTIPKDVSITDALADAGVYIPTSCEQGVCGTCLTRVLEGTPDHRDLFLMPDEQEANDQFTPCCSRSKSPLLVLDL